MVTWHVMVSSDPEGNTQVGETFPFDKVEDAKVKVFDLISDAAPAKIEYTKKFIYERFEVAPVNPGPEVWTPFYVWIVGMEG